MGVGPLSSLVSQDTALSAFAEVVGDSGPVAVAGSRTRWELGGSLAENTTILEAPTGIVSYQPDEMTVQVRVGTPVAELNLALAEAGQRCALPERGGTVGGALAVGENALTMLGVGRLRDSVLQLRYVSAEGEVVTSGGPTVKNVSGFNLPRLMVGSLGTLGLLAEATIRTNPSPTESRWFQSSDSDPTAILDAVLRPGAVLWDGQSTWVLLEGHPPDVVAERKRIGELGAFAEVDGPPPLPPHRWSLKPSELPGLSPETEPAGASANGTGSFVASVGVGTVHAENPQPHRTPDAASLVVAGRLKQLFDPTGRLAPGRSVS